MGEFRPERSEVYISVTYANFHSRAESKRPSARRFYRHWSGGGYLGHGNWPCWSVPDPRRKSVIPNAGSPKKEEMRLKNLDDIRTGDAN